MKVHIIFDGPPGPGTPPGMAQDDPDASSYSGRLVEVEDEHGKGLSIGRWSGPDKDGLWSLELDVNDQPRHVDPVHGTPLP